MIQDPYEKKLKSEIKKLGRSRKNADRKDALKNALKWYEQFRKEHPTMALFLDLMTLQEEECER